MRAPREGRTRPRVRPSCFGVPSVALWPPREQIGPKSRGRGRRGSPPSASQPRARFRIGERAQRVFADPAARRLLRCREALGTTRSAAVWGDNRLSLREGHQALDAQRLGRAAEALQLALLQSQPPAPGRDPVLHFFPAWPKDWNASFKLLARGGFVVTASMRAGRIEAIELESLAGARCRLRNAGRRAASR